MLVTKKVECLAQPQSKYDLSEVILSDKYNYLAVVECSTLVETQTSKVELEK